jgi:hypothetical protein
MIVDEHLQNTPASDPAAIRTIDRDTTAAAAP